MKELIKIFSFFFFTILFWGCGESELEKQTRQEYSTVIRRIDANYQNLEDNKEQEESLSLIKVRDFYESYTSRFSEIRDDLASAPSAEKFDDVKNNLEDILTLSNSFVNNRQSLVIDAINASNAIGRYIDDLEDFVDYVNDYDRYSSERILNSRINRMIEDSVDFYSAYNNLKANIGARDSLIVELENTSQRLNEVASEYDYPDTLQFYRNIDLEESIVAEVWENLKDVEMRPTRDARNRINR